MHTENSQIRVISSVAYQELPTDHIAIDIAGQAVLYLG